MGGSFDIPRLENWEDAFDNQVSARTNVLDLAAHYPYSPERWRMFVDGSRVFPEYDTVDQYNHADDYHELQPNAGETVTLQSAEKPRYVVQYELAATWAFAVNQSLQAGDSIRIGLYDGSDGWYVEHNGGHSDTEADIVLERNGSEVYRREDKDIHKTVTSNARLKLQTGWYDITRQQWERSYPDSGTQRNKKIISTSADDQRGSRTGNLPIHFSVTASGSTSNLILEAGSAAQVNLGTTTEFRRVKIAEVIESSIDTAGSWVPIHAIRVRPEYERIDAQMSNLKVHEYTANDDVRIIALAHDPSKVLDSGGNPLGDSDFNTPVEHSESNSVIEETENVDQAPDSTGTPVTDTSNPGGYQIGLASLYTSGTGATVQRSNASVQEKRSIHNGDHVVFWGYSETIGDVTFNYTTEQDW